MKSIKKFIAHLNLDDDLIYSFFIYFSRFEYVLKRAGYFKSIKKAEPNCDKFASELKNIFFSNKPTELKQAVQYLLKNPPKRQINNNGKLNWKKRNINSDNISNILLLIRDVKNNLFHGGKFPPPIEDISRNSKLIRSSLIILSECLELSIQISPGSKVKNYFY